MKAKVKTTPAMTLRGLIAIGCVLALSACVERQAGRTRLVLPDILQSEEIAPPVIRQPVLPELLVACRGHVLVPALGMTFVNKGAEAPSAGNFLREESLTPPYRIIAPGARISMEHSAQRLNVELDKYKRVIGLYCG